MLPEASRIMRASRGYRDQPPVGARYWVWKIAYPEAYAQWVHRYAKKLDLPSAFLFAVAREESAFNPEAVSPARAYGLMQLIAPTARQVAKPLGLRPTPAALRSPKLNIRLGAHFIRQLWDRYADNPAIIPAAYNAGPRAADRWLTQPQARELDAWVEAIPYRETRRYTRRVLQSYGIYHWLYQGELPEFGTKLPPSS